MPDGTQTPITGAAEAVTIIVDGKEMEARKGEMVIAAAERGGVYIPRFCWHPRMRAVGMCRMCLVEIKGPRGFALSPACYVPVADGQEVVTTSPKVKKAQDGVLEFLLINHPLDCPVCDRGGECPLQDQTFAFGPGESRFVEEKRHWEKPIPISPLVLLDRERCIQCSRCTRFADEVAGDAMIDFVGRSDLTEVNIFPGEPFTSNFSGNIVQICPVGALLAEPYRFRARPWDLDVVESTCTACAVGCRMAVQSSADQLIRNLGIDSDPVNHGWLCDKGRFGYEADNSDVRLTEPMTRSGEALAATSWPAALQAAADGLRQVVESTGPQAVAVLGGARLANEDAYAWARLAKGVLSTDNVDCQMGDGLPAEVVLGLPRATIDDACSAHTVILLAPDLKEELPILYLRLREAVVEKGVNLIEIVPSATGLTKHATVTLMHRPGEAAAVARALAGDQIPADGAGGVPAADLGRAADILRQNLVVIVLGRPSLAESANATVDAAGVLARAMPGARFLSALRRGNVHGALDMGLAPGILPGRVSLADGRAHFASQWGLVPQSRGLDAEGILRAAADGRIEVLVLLGADPAADFPDRDLARRALARVPFTIAIDAVLTESSRGADVVFPAGMWGERAGTTTNIEGRVTRLGHKVTPPGTGRPDWMVAVELARRLGADMGLESLDAIAAEIAALAPSHAGLSTALLAGRASRDGIVVPVSSNGHAPDSPDSADPSDPDPSDSGGRPVEEVEVAAAQSQGETVQAETEPAPTDVAPPSPPQEPAGGGVPLLSFSPVAATTASPPVDAYSLRLVSGRCLYDAGVLVQQSPALAQLVPGARLRAHPSDLGRLGVSTGDSVRVSSSRGSLTLTAVADRAVLRGSAVLAFNQPGPGAADLIDASLPITDVRVETVGPGPAPQ